MFINNVKNSIKIMKSKLLKENYLYLLDSDFIFFLYQIIRLKIL